MPKIRELGLLPANAPQIIGDNVVTFYFEGYGKNEPIFIGGKIIKATETQSAGYDLFFINPSLKKEVFK